ncbi:unnamed protein product [Phytomonas sp. EM1]|nr:unnamed protein product [Phytomonas sp. EM1]|eukprot:CCW65411.1 unnamed protein product [Phytomonas sp. isolate EM1]
MNDTTNAAAQPHLPHGGSEDETLLKNVVDFLGIMYSNKSIVGDENRQMDGAHSIPASGTAGHRLSTRASLYKRALGTVQPSHAATKNTVPPGGTTKDGVQRPKSAGENDYIGQLLDHLVRTYSTQRIPDDLAVSRGERRANPVSNSDRKNAAAQLSSLQNIPDDIDMSIFVNQTLDCFLRPGTQPNSAGSILSALEMDTNFAKLLSFETRSNLQYTMDEIDDKTETLKPMFVGKQAMFKSMGSAQKSESSDHSSNNVCATKIPLPCLSTTQKGCAAGTGSVLPPSQSMTLDSKAFDLSHPSDTFNELAKGGGTSLRSRRGAHGEPSFSDHVDMSTSMNALMSQEALSRNILLALEQQLRGYIVSAYHTKHKRFGT